MTSAYGFCWLRLGNAQTSLALRSACTTVGRNRLAGPRSAGRYGPIAAH